MANHILSIILFTPLVGALIVLLLPKDNKNAIRWVANMFAARGCWFRCRWYRCSGR